MDFSTYSDDELANIQKDLLDEAEARAARLSPGAVKNHVTRALKMAHRALYVVKQELVDGEIITPMSGGDPKPEEP